MASGRPYQRPLSPEPRQTIAVGALFFPVRGADARPMPRYFFILAYAHRELSDPKGLILPSDEAAIAAARKVIDELRAEQEPQDPNPTIVVKNAAGEIVYRYPSN